MSLLGKIAAKLDSLFGMDIRALALLRIGLSAAVFLQCLDHLPHVKAFFAEDGVLPARYALGPSHYWHLCVNVLNGSWQFQLFLLLLTAAAALCLMAGYKTRLCTFALWILLCSFHNRNWPILGAEDKLMHILFFWLLFVPWGACYSVDNSGPRRRIVPLRASSMGTMAYLLQIAMFYGFAGLLKYAPSWTESGAAMWIVLNGREFTKPLGESLLPYHGLLAYCSHLTVYLERLAPLFFFMPVKTNCFRLTALAALALFHISIMLCMELKYFQWICLITLLGFLPTAFLNKFLRVPAYADPSVRYPARPSWKPDLFQMPPHMSLLVGALIVYTFLWNVLDLSATRKGDITHRPIIGRTWDAIGHALSLRQHWGMYGPDPFRDDGWYVMPGTLQNGTTVDVFRSGQAVNWAEPASIIELNKNYSWTLFYMNMHRLQYRSHLKPWGGYICREWNASHPPDQRLVRFEIVFMERLIVPYKKPVPRRRPLRQVWCPAPGI